MRTARYRDNSTESFIAINCLDYTDQSDVAVMRAEAAALAEAAPAFGPYFVRRPGCVNWPFPGDREREPIAADGRRTSS